MADGSKVSIPQLMNDYMKTPPVDVVSLAQAIGYEVISIEFKKANPKFENMFFVYHDLKSNINTIAVDKTEEEKRKRFAIAIGIALIQSSFTDRLEEGVIFKWVDEGICSAPVLSEAENDEIKRSALELLIPSDLLLGEVMKVQGKENNNSLFDSLLSLFDVSKDMLNARIRYLLLAKKK